MKPSLLTDLRLFSLVCVVLGGTGQGVVAPKLPELFRDSESLALTTGLSGSLMYLGIYVSTFQYGRWADEGKFHWLLAPGLFLYAVTLVIMGATSSPSLLLGVRFLEGLALSAIFVAADFALGRLSAPNERGQWLSYYGVAMSIGLLLGPALSLLLAKSGPSFGGPAMAPLLLVSIGATSLGSLSLRKRIPRATERAERPECLNRGALSAGAAYGFMEAGLVAVFPVLAVRSFHVLPEYCLFVVILSAALSSVGWGILSDRRGARPVLLVLTSGLALGPLALLALQKSLPLAGIAFSASALFGILAGGIYPVGFNWLLESLPDTQYGYASGSFARAYGLGSLAGPLLAGYGVERFGAGGLFVILGLVGTLTTAYLFKYPSPRPIPATSPAEETPIEKRKQSVHR